MQVTVTEQIDVSLNRINSSRMFIKKEHSI